MQSLKSQSLQTSTLHSPCLITSSQEPPSYLISLSYPHLPAEAWIRDDTPPPAMLKLAPSLLSTLLAWHHPPSLTHLEVKITTGVFTLSPLGGLPTPAILNKYRRPVCKSPRPLDCLHQSWS